MDLKKTPLIVKIIAAIAVVVFLVYLIKPNAAKSIYKLATQQASQKEQISKQKYDSIQTLRQIDYLEYVDKISQNATLIKTLQDQLKTEKSKRYYYEKELYNYRAGNFNQRFAKFSSLVRKDSVE